MAIFSIRQGQDDGKQSYITGNQGKYNEIVKNPKVRYARNAMNNFEQYVSYRLPKIKYPDLSNISSLSDDKFERKMEQLSDALKTSKEAIKTIPFLDYTIKYLPQKTTPNAIDDIDTVALIGAAFEDMGRKLSVSTQSLTKKMQKALDTENVSAAALDLDKNGKIDVAEYATSILTADMLSSASLDKKDIKGKITKDGHDRLISFFDKRNSYLPERVFGHLYDFFALDLAKEKFVKNPNNTAI